MNAEDEKMQKIIIMDNMSVDELIKLNKSVIKDYPCKIASAVWPGFLISIAMLFIYI